MNSTAYVEKISNLFGRIIAKSLQHQVPGDDPDVDLTFQQFQAMILADQLGACSVGDIASKLAISHPAAVKLIDRLRRKGLVSKQESPEDRRVSRVTLTALGQRVVDSVRQRRTEAIAKALETMSDEERDGLVKALEKLLTATLTTENLMGSTCLRCGVSHAHSCPLGRTHTTSREAE